MSEREESIGYLLRLNQEYSLDTIAKDQRYFSGIIRKWVRGTNLFLLQKTSGGDAFVAYAVIDNIEALWEMTPADCDYAREHGWRQLLTFRTITVFKTPLLLKHSVFKGDHRKGAFLHGIKITEEEGDSILCDASADGSDYEKADWRFTK